MSSDEKKGESGSGSGMNGVEKAEDLGTQTGDDMNKIEDGGDSSMCASRLLVMSTDCDDDDSRGGGSKSSDINSCVTKGREGRGLPSR